MGKNKFLDERVEEKDVNVISEQPEVKEEPVELVAEDRSAYNCSDCKGEGLKENLRERCDTCHGTGKVS